MSNAVPPPGSGSPASASAAASAGVSRGTPGSGRPSPEALLSSLARDERRERLTHVHRVPARAASPAPWPEWVTPSLYAALTQAGLSSLWSHQLEAAETAHAGTHVVLSTGTASGKSLGFLLPALSDVVDGSTAPNGRGATALYVAPTKALAHDQLDRLHRLALPGLRAAAYDGDTSPEDRRWVREHANYVLTNPDLLHHSLLPGHEHWAPFLRALRYVVLDECHVYRGVFGSHLAMVLRRLRRVCARFRSAPTFVLASATVAEPAVHAGRLVGMPVHPVTEDGSPRAALTFGLWQPGETGNAWRPHLTPEPPHGDGGPELESQGDNRSEPEAPESATTVSLKPDGSGRSSRRRSAVAESADLLTDLVAQGVQTVAFARSRAGVEVISAAARSHLCELDVALGDAVAAYRGGYLPEERRELEAALRAGGLLGLAATTALELGIDISGLDAVLLAGWPGTRASMWQQAGRAGRAGAESLAVLVAADDPLDTYLVNHPDAVFGQSIEAAVLDPENPYVLGPHLAAAAAELPLTEADATYFGPSMPPLLDGLTASGVLRRRPTGWFVANGERPADRVSLRGSGTTLRIADHRTGRVLGTIDDARSHTAVHPGAVYVHQGETYVVLNLDLDEGCALVRVGDPGWSTQARSVSAFDIVAVERSRQWGAVGCHFGDVRVQTQVTSFLRRLPTGEVIGEHPLVLPVRSLPTKAVWWTIPVELLAAWNVPEAAIPGAAHAAEHAAIGMLPLVATSDRWDIGGVSTERHPDTGLPTVLVYDGYPGGAGFAERGYHAMETWLSGTRDAIAGCACLSGCPSCVQSPKCGNGNEPLDKARAVSLLDITLDGAHRRP
ncbi:MAG TPA: DEAD/DEAH box helicase [Lapillicoccus sp.]|nr:DEAD/DEAH box helicase [Lapillicoccus sp.]